MKTLKPKKRRSRRFRQRKRRRMPINVAASVITTFSLYCGAASIIASINLEFEAAAYWILAAMVLDTVSPAKARCPVSASYRTQPKDQMSLRLSSGSALACSGLM